jgi:hypothetical protein
MDREQRIAEPIREVARSRLDGEVLTSKGDLISEELNDTETATVSDGGTL